MNPYLKILAWFAIICATVWLVVYIIDAAENPNSNQLINWGIAKDSPVR